MSQVYEKKIDWETYNDFGKAVDEDLRYGILFPESADCPYWEAERQKYSDGKRDDPPMSATVGDTVENFKADLGEPDEKVLTARGVDVYSWEGFQDYKGQTRYRLIVADYGQFMLSVKC